MSRVWAGETFAKPSAAVMVAIAEYRRVPVESLASQRLADTKWGERWVIFLHDAC